MPDRDLDSLLLREAEARERGRAFRRFLALVVAAGIVAILGPKVWPEVLLTIVVVVVLLAIAWVGRKG
jgi:uncharacterized membrane protein